MTKLGYKTADVIPNKMQKIVLCNNVGQTQKESKQCVSEHLRYARLDKDELVSTLIYQRKIPDIEFRHYQTF